MSIPYAELVVSRVINEPFRALAPSYGVDVAVVGKWALSSLRLRTRRDRILATLLLTGLAGPGVIFASARPWQLRVALLACLVIAILSAAWAAVLSEYLRRLRCVRRYMLRGRFEPRAAPEPRSRLDRERLAAVSIRRRGNLVVFRGNNAFVGSGSLLSREHLVIDVSRTKTDGAENHEADLPPSFTNEEVHSAIITAMEDLLGHNNDDLRVEERLYVNGRHVQNRPAFLPDPKAPPTAWVDPAMLYATTQHPTPDARTYVCVEMQCWQGQLIATLFARAVHVGGSLYIEWRFHVLPPLRPEFQQVDRLHEDSAGRDHLHAAWRCFKKTPPALLLAPIRIGRSHWSARRASKNIASQARAIDHGQVFDYGALRSIREYACGTGRQHHFLGRDEVMFVVLAQEKLIRAVGNFLAEKKVDTGELEAQVKIINERTYNFNTMHLGDVTNSSIAFGAQAQATNTQPAGKT